MSIKSAIILAWSLAIVAHLFFINNYWALIFLFAIPKIHKDTKIKVDKSTDQNKIHFLFSALKINLVFSTSLVLYLMIILFY